MLGSKILTPNRARFTIPKRRPLSRHGSASNVHLVRDKQHIVPPTLENTAIVSEHDKLFNQKPVKKQKSYDQNLNMFLRILGRKPFHEALESFYKRYFPDSTTIYWEAVDEVQSLYSETRNYITSYSTGLLGFAFNSKKILRLSDADHHPSYHETDQKFIPAQSNLLLIPVSDISKKLIGLIQILRINDNDYNLFTLEDETFAQWFQKKLSLISQFIPSPNSTELDLLKLENCTDFFKSI